MSVTIDSDSADRLLAEGAVCIDADSSSATCEGTRVPIPTAGEATRRPVLVCGRTVVSVNRMARLLEDRGVVVWRVVQVGSHDPVPSVRGSAANRAV